MATPFYDNEYVANRERKRAKLGVKVEPRVPSIDPTSFDRGDDGRSVEQLLEDAKGTLEQSGEFFKDVDPAARYAQRAENLDAPSVLDTPMQKLARLSRRGGRALSKFATGKRPIAIASNILELSGVTPAKRLLTGESEGVVGTGLDALSVLPALSAGSKALKGLKALKGASAPVLEAVQGAEMFNAAYPGKAAAATRARLSTAAPSYPKTTKFPGVDAVRTAGEEGILRNAPFGEGGIMPSAMLPSELRDPALEGLSETPGALESLREIPRALDLPESWKQFVNYTRPAKAPYVPKLTPKEIAQARSKERFGRSFRSE